MTGWPISSLCPRLPQASALGLALTDGWAALCVRELPILEKYRRRWGSHNSGHTGGELGWMGGLTP